MMLLSLLIAINFFSVSIDSTNISPDQDALLNGIWRGTSVCEDRTSACKDEAVVYHLSHEAESSIVKVSADKIMEGKAVEMGTLVFEYDKENKTLTNKNGNNVWHLTIRGNQLMGTLMRDGAVFRKVALTRD